jgi:hypothetical protein
MSRAPFAICRSDSEARRGPAPARAARGTTNLADAFTRNAPGIALVVGPVRRQAFNVALSRGRRVGLIRCSPTDLWPDCSFNAARGCG